MTDRKRNPEPPDDDVVFLDEGSGDDVARAVEDAVRAVTAVESRHRRQEAGAVPAAAEARAPESTEAHPEDLLLPEDRIAQLASALEAERDRAEKAEEEAGQLREALLRKAADLENVRRRTEKERNDQFRFALAEVFRDLLGVLDNFERALAHAPEGIRGGDFCAGVEMISKQLSEVLRRYGLTEIAALGVPFDPNIHDAVAGEESEEVPPGTVLEVFQKGYFLNDRLLRPAMVKVSSASVKARPESGQ